MSLIVELPLPINEELAQESRREGISEKEHAALLLCLASAFQQEESLTPFQNAVRVFLSQQSLDAARVFSAFEELVRVCLDVPDSGISSQNFRTKRISNGSQSEYDFLKHWRNSIVHQRDMVSEQEVTDPNKHVHNLLAQWQADDHTPLRSPLPTRPGETPAQSLFRKWDEEDANMTDEEREAEDQLWEDIEQGLKHNGRKLQLRRLG